MLLLLIRHAITDLTSKQLVGRRPGVHLSPKGQAQATGLVELLHGIPIAAIYSSPLERAVETAAPLAADRQIEVRQEAGLSEVDYGDWAGQEFKQLRRTDLWKRVQLRPADARFPGGEAVREAQARIVGSLEGIANAHARETVAVFSHSDMIKFAVAHLTGLHLDMFQRLAISPASVTAILLGGAAPALIKMNHTGDLSELVPARRRAPARKN
ncbi:MAG TPA: MSMEG_4193 family putative phosphomutase [Candidatus Solibacter sp.]|nr:MSMEG_4193 family putative phosphomutase [Candidatus Solibacter sp.]